MRSLRIKYLFVSILAAYCIAAPIVAHSEDIGDYDEVRDPIEGFNRGIYKFNTVLDKAVFKPVAKGYRKVVPELARRGVTNVLNNLSEPVTLFNSVLQGDVEHSFTTFWRFTINSTMGIGGLFDVAKDAGLQYRKEDFGQTAGIYGSGKGPYLMLPVLGPSNGRDTFGKVVDVFTDPFNYVFDDYGSAVRAGFGGLDARESSLELTDHIEKTSLDPYATVRSLYTQKREDDIHNGHGE